MFNDEWAVGRPEAGSGGGQAAMFNVECLILDDEWAEGSGGGQAAMFNVECWILDGGGGGKLGVIR